MALPEILTYIKTQLETLSGIGEVYDHYNYARSRKQIMEGYQGEARINAWFVSRYKTVDSYHGPNILKTAHTIHIYGYHNIKEKLGTATTFQDLIENIRAKFQNDYTLGGNCHYCPPMLLKYVDHDDLLHFPCHVGLLVLSPTIRTIL